MKKKILIFHSALAPYRVDFFNVLSKIFDTTIVYLSKNVRNQNFDREKLLLQSHYTPHYLKHKITVTDRDINVGYTWYIFNKKPDIIFGGEYGLPTIIPFIIKKLFFRKYKIYTICDDSLQMSEECDKIRSIIRKFLAPRIDGIIVVGKQTADWYKSHFTLKSEPIIFPILQDEKTFRDKLQASLPISKQYITNWNLNKKKILLFVGRFVEIKGLDRILKAFSAADLNEDTVMVFVGEGELMNTLKQQAEQLGITDKVLFVGRYDNLKLLAWYNIGSCLILASHQEAFGAVVNEGLMSGCYALCSSRAGASSLIKNGINGHVFDTYNNEELSRYISSISNRISPIYIELLKVKPSLMIDSFDKNMENLLQRLNN